MSIKLKLYNLIQSILTHFDFTLVKISDNIGLEACFNGIKKRGVIPKVIYDVGASNGKWTKRMMRYYPHSNYFLIEPLYENEKELKTLSDSYNNIKYFLCCAGNYDGEVEISIKDDIDCSSIIEKGVQQRKVPITKIDSLVEAAKLPLPNLMKLDVQGYELNVLLGSLNTIKNCEFILLEQQFFRFSPKMKILHESIKFMTDYGFRPYEIVDIMRRPYDNAMGQCDILYINNKSELLNSTLW